MFYLTWFTNKDKHKTTTVETIDEVYRWLSKRVGKEQICWVTTDPNNFDKLAGTEGDDSGVYTVFKEPFSHEEFEKVDRELRFGIKPTT